MMMMKLTLKRLSFPAIPTALILAQVFFSHSCANTTQAPTGGLKDTIPPVLINVVPPSGTTGIPVTGMHFQFSFDEYVQVKSAQNIFLSPPSRKVAKTRMKGRTLDVFYEDTLLENTTYTIDFTGALADNNEGNPFPGYTYVFSTGSTIDTFMITGTVLDCDKLMPVKDATVMLYDDLRDSAALLLPASYATRTDDWGYFVIRNIPPRPYRLYAVTDVNNNRRYDPDGETVAFVDSIVTPSVVVDEESPELRKYEMTDTLQCLSRHSEYKMRLFREMPSKQFLRNKGRVDDRSSFISFNARNAHIDTMWMAGFSPGNLITQFNPERDSLEIWVNSTREMPDTFMLFVNYLKTDTLGLPASTTETIKLPNPVPKRAKRHRKESDIKREDTCCVFDFAAKGESVEEEGISLTFKYPIVSWNLDSLKFISTNPKQQDFLHRASFVQDSVNLKKFHIVPDIDGYKEGYEYTVKIPHHAFVDINGNPSDSLVQSFSLPTDEALSTLTLAVSGAKEGVRYILELMDGGKSSVIHRYIVDSDRQIEVKYLQKGAYTLRITTDDNRNSIIDTGDLLQKKQPEMVVFYEVEKGVETMDIPERSVIFQEIRLDRQ